MKRFAWACVLMLGALGCGDEDGSGDACALVDCAPGFVCAEGECVPEEPCGCPDLYEPVCAEDGNTYGNACLAECEGLLIVNESVCDLCLDDGQCEPDEICVDWPEEEPSYCVWVGCDSHEQCRQGERCLFDDLCLAPAAVGPCDAAFLRWFYNADTERCEEFTWGGCGGNENNFETVEQCEARCPSELAPKLSIAARAGRCEPDPYCPGDFYAPGVYAPVCGVDDVTYGNPCESERAGVDIAYDGECMGGGRGCMDQGCPDDWSCNHCQTSTGPRYICLSPLAGACLPPDEG